MHRLLTALRRGFKEKIGWKRLGIAASLLIIIFAVTHLVRTLKGVDTGIILTALTEIAPHRIALAALLVNDDGSVDLYFGPEAPAGKEQNWTQTVPGKGWYAMLRAYGPLEAWFDKSWQPGEFERVS